MESFFRRHYKIINVKIILLIGLIGFYLANKNSYMIYENIVYDLSRNDLMYLIIGDKGFYMTILYVFMPMIYYIFFWKDKSEFEKIRYKSRQRQYKNEIIEIFKFVIMYISIIFFYSIISSVIKGNGEVGLTMLIKEFYLDSSMLEGALNLALYNIDMIIFLGSIIFILFYFFLGNIMCFINMLFRNKFITLIVGIIIINLVVYYTTFGNGTSVVEYLVINHINIFYDGFGLMGNRYLNMIISIVYFIMLNMMAYGVGNIFAKKKEVFNYKGGMKKWNLV